MYAMLKLQVILLFIILSHFPNDLLGQSEVAHFDSVPAYPSLVNDLLAEGAGNDMFPGISVALYTEDSAHYFSF